MNTQEVANRLVEMCRQGQHMDALSELYAENCVSHEMPGMPNEVTEGLPAVTTKSEEWLASVEEMHSSEVSDPVVAGDHFSCTMKFDCTFKERGRIQMEEICVYQVADGKIANERFFYSMGQLATTATACSSTCESGAT